MRDLYLFVLFTIIYIPSSYAQNSSYNANTVPIGGTNNASLGVGTLISNIGSRNIGLGSDALHSNITGNINIAIGTAALYSNISYSRNIAIGDSAMYANINGSGCVAVGHLAMLSNISGYQNTAIGERALFSNVNGLNNTAINSFALYRNISGNQNTAIGVAALMSNQTGGSNTAIGNASLYNNVSSRNVAIGVNTLVNNTTGSQNTAVGTWSLLSNISGSNNVACGYSALFVGSDGNNNVAVGDSAGFNNIGNGNIYIGKRSGYNEIGDNKIYIANDSNRTILYGDLATGQILIGKKDPFGYIFKGNRSLNVLGGILTDSVRVALSGDWADYVFTEGYNLKSLEKLSDYIKTNKHLPNIPTAAEAKNNGIDISKMQIKLLEKIEELTLYLLQQQKDIAHQNKNIRILKKEINHLRGLLKK